MADLIVVGTDGVHQHPAADPYSPLVYASRPSDVRATVVGGQVVVRTAPWPGRSGPVAEDAVRARRTPARASRRVTGGHFKPIVA